MVIILDEKPMIPPPPPYVADSPSADQEPPPVPPFPGTQLSSIHRPPANFEALPPHLVLHIVDLTLMPRKAGVGKPDVEYTRKVLYWMTICLRLVNRSLYIACMHVLRSTYLPAYLSMIKPPHTSDPFPLLTPGYGSAGIITSSSTMVSPVNSVQRETQVLDMFLAAKVREDVWADDTELHLEREEAFQDLFSVLQPRARLEDLVRTYGTEAGVISVSSSTGNAIIASTPCAPSSSTSSPYASPSAPSFPSSIRPPHFSSSQYAPSLPYPFNQHGLRQEGHTTRRVPFSALTCSFGPRSAGLVLTSKSGRRTIVEVSRAKDEKLEVAAKKLVKGLKSWAAENYTIT